MKKTVIPVAVLLGLLLLGSTSLAARPQEWYTEFISDVFTWPAEGSCTLTWWDQTGNFTQQYTVEVDDEAPAYDGIVLLRPYGPKALLDRSSLYCDYPEGTQGPFHIQPGQLVRYHTGWVDDERSDFEGLTRTVTSNCEPETVELEQTQILPFFPSTYSRLSCLWTLRP